MTNNIRYTICSLIRVGLSVIVMVNSILAFTEQSDQKAPPSPGTVLTQVIRLGGWTIPGLRYVVAVSKTEFISINGFEVQRKKLKLSREPFYEREIYFRGDDGILRIGPSSWVVRNIIAYELNGKTFAYQVDLVRVDITNGVRTYIGIMSTYYYSDEDGDGKFEKRQDVGLESLLSIPDWVKQKNGKNKNQ